MEDEDVVLSEVHTCDTSPVSYFDYSDTGYETRFKFRVFITEECTSIDSSDSQSDGSDYDLPRNSRASCEWDEYIVIRHAMRTTLPRVGLQVWQGAFLLADWILNNQEFLKDKIVLELGSGSGFTAILAAMFARKVYATDVDDEILSLCQWNFDQNVERLKLSHDSVLVRKLDWFDYNDLIGNNEFSFQEADRHSLKQIDVIIASDVVYQTAATKALLSLIESFLSGELCRSHEQSEIVSRPRLAIISIEKRVVFSVDSLSVCCPEYEYFLKCLDELRLKTNPSFLIEQLTIDLLGRFVVPRDYRSENLVIWKISTSASN